MTKEQLEQYPNIVMEIKDLENELGTIVTDKVTGSLDEYPYTEQTVTIKGLPYKPDKKKRLDEARIERKEIEDFINSLPYELKRIVGYKIRGKGWAYIAAKFEGKYLEDTLRQKYSRFLKKL